MVSWERHAKRNNLKSRLILLQDCYSNKIRRALCWRHYLYPKFTCVNKWNRFDGTTPVFFQKYTFSFAIDYFERIVTPQAKLI